jgi:hypothetical protein
VPGPVWFFIAAGGLGFAWNSFNTVHKINESVQTGARQCQHRLCRPDLVARVRCHLGLVAVIAAVIFVPAVTVPLISSMAKRFLECLWCVVAVVAVLMCVGSYWVGHWDAESDCRAGEIEAKLRNARIDAENAADDEFQGASEIETTAKARQNDDHDYITHLEARPSCNLDDNELGLSGRMRNDKPRSGRSKPATGAR